MAAGTHSLTFASTLPYDYALGGIKVDDLKVTAIAAAVPEPETLALMLAGVGAFGFVARRRSPRHD